METKIEIHNSERQFARSKELLMQDPLICKENKEIILQFILDCEMGKTLRNTSKKKIETRRLTRLVDILRNFSHWFNKPFNEITQEDLERVIFKLEKGEYKKKFTTRVNGEFVVRLTDKPYSNGSVVYFKKVLKKFDRWLKVNKINLNLDMGYVEIIEQTQTDFEIITRKELNTLLEHADSTFWRAFISILWSCGFRIEETLNIRMRHVIPPHNTEEDNENHIIKIMFSKNKFGIRNAEVLLECANKYLKEWIDEYKTKEGHNDSSPLFPIKYITAFSKLQSLGKKCLNKKVGCHTFRHSSATYWCNILTHAKLCCLMGWAFSSKMPDVYIKRSSVMSDKTAIKLIKNLEISEFKQENDSLKEELSQLKIRQTETEEMLKKMASQLQSPMQIPYNGNTAIISVSGLSYQDNFMPFEIPKKDIKTNSFLL
ncbi:MAG: tyrosine-type recombinase/integrase [Candidatus Pacearchaeota archaeon]|jgi:integrase